MKPEPPRPADRFADALRALAAALDECGRPAMIIGGVAVIARGVARLTRDIDATVIGEHTDLDALLATCSRHDVSPRIDAAAEFARRHQVLLLRHDPSGVDIDLSLAWLPFETEAIGAAEAASVHGVDVRLARAEDLVIYKFVAWRPTDRTDVEQLLAMHHERMDLKRVRRLADEVAAALEEPARAAELKRLLARVRGIS